MRTDHEASLRQCGLKSTPHRLAMLALLEHADQPMAAEQVYLDLRERDVAINLSTVYRALESLADKNLVRRLAITGDGRALYEYNRSAHRHYLVCLECKKIKAIDSCPLGGYEKVLEDKTDYRIEGHRLDLYGYCPVCRAALREKN